MYRCCPEEYGIARCLRTGYPTATINPFGRYDEFGEIPWYDCCEDEEEDDWRKSWYDEEDDEEEEE